MIRTLLLLFISLLLISPAQALEIKEVTSSKGIKAWLVQDKDLPLITMHFSFKGGVETDPKDKQGLATLTANMLTQGAGTLDEEAFQKALASDSIKLGFSAGRDYINGQLKTLTRTKEKAFGLLALTLTKPRFDKPVLDRLLQQQRAAMRARLADPNWQGRVALYQRVYGEHPYSFRSLGSEKTLRNIQREDAVRFVQERLVHRGLQIVVVGNISVRELARSLDEVFGGLLKAKKTLDLQNVTWPEKAVTVQVSRESAQTNVFFVAPMLKRTHPDWYAAQIANYILGGGSFTSRLQKTLRIREGLTYGVSTGLASMKLASMFLGQFSTENEKAGEALRVVKEEMTAFYHDGITEEELQAAKDYFIGGMALSLTSRDEVAATLLSMLNNNLSQDYLTVRAERLKAVTKEDVERVIKKWFDPKSVSFSFVGRPKGVETQWTQPLIME